MITPEKAVLGSILLENQSIVSISKHITHTDFVEPNNAILFRTMVQMYDAHKAIDVLTLSQALEERGYDGRVRNEEIVELIEIVPTACNSEHYATLVKEASIKDRLIKTGAKITEFAKTKPAAEAVERSQVELSLVAKQASQTEIITLGEALSEAYKRIEMVHRAGSRITGVSTGFPRLDNYLAGLHTKELVLLAARPGMGKTALAITLGINVAKQNQGVLVFSLEMAPDQIGARVISQKSGVPLQALRQAQVKDKEWPAVTKVTGSHESLPMHIVDKADLTISQLRTISRDHASRHNMRLVVVDYIQLLRSPGAERREREVAEISAGLKALAKELDITVLGLSQLNRMLEQRPNKRPTLGDLRESGGLEQDADVVVFIYRDDYYNKSSKDPNTAELIVAKQRQGPCGTAKVEFIAERTEFIPRESVSMAKEDPVAEKVDLGKLVKEMGGMPWIRKLSEDLLEKELKKEGRSHMKIERLWEEIVKASPNSGLPLNADGAAKRLKRALHTHGFWVANDGTVAIDHPTETDSQ